MRALSRLLPLAALIALSAPALADMVNDGARTASAQPGLLTPPEQASYRAIFAAIHARDFAGAARQLDALPTGALTTIARAELYLASGAPLVDATTLATLVTTAPELPEAVTLAKMARDRGATALPTLPAQHDVVRFANPSKRLPTRSALSNAISARLAAKVQPLLKTNDAATAEPLVEAQADALSSDALTEWRQRVAWSYMLANDDPDARRVAAIAATGTGEWAAQAAWVLGLASWRAGDMDAASDAFATLPSRTRDPEMMAAGLYWSARSDTAGGHPERADPKLRSAARLSETFYGMLASGIIGLDKSATPFAAVLAPTSANARTAAALVEIGETALADQLLRQQARIGNPGDHAALVALAGRLSLPATQVWLAQNGPSGITISTAQRYPMPAWAPPSGWRVDPALCLAHSLQESQMRVDAVSHAGARGLMQLMPTTAQLVARHKGETAPLTDRLSDPALSLEYGQSYLEELADNAATQGVLPKVIAAYNAGPNNVAAWNARAGASQDPLFFIETMPFAETRTYVTTVLRNYWMYQRETGTPTESLSALVEGRWPTFPRTVAPARMAAPAQIASASASTN